MKFSDLSIYLEKLESTSSRIEITKILSDLFKKSDSNEIDKTVYLALGELAPSYRGIILNLAEKMMFRVLAHAYSKDETSVKNLFKKLGDIGKVASNLNSGKEKSDITVTQVWQKLVDIAQVGGEGSQDKKIMLMSDLLSKLDPLSVRFVARIPVGKLRLGFSDKTILDALSWMEKGDKSVKSDLEKAYQVLPDPGLLAQKVKKEGTKKAAKEVKPVIGIPVLPMLCQRLKAPSDMIEKMGSVSVEPKLDGLRLLIHISPIFIKAFTRNLNETSWMFPELQKAKEFVNARQVILDCEAVGLDEETKKMADFQTTMTRRRKHEIENVSKKIGIEFFIFDILLKDGQNLMDEPYAKRREILEKTLKAGRNFKLVEYELTQDPQRINELYRKRTSEGYEGIIVKKADSYYVPGRTGWNWVKMKQEETASGKLSDTLDCIVMGYTQGKGKRATFGLGQFLVGIKDNESIKTITKVGTGITDVQFRELKTRLEKLKVKDKPRQYLAHKNYTPDFWVEPSLVVEIAGDEITKSPTHTAGLALRFPRLVRFRDDKSVDQATTLEEVKNLFKLQKR